MIAQKYLYFWVIKNYKNVQTSKECDIETFFANVLRSTIKPDLFKDYQIK